MVQGWKWRTIFEAFWTRFVTISHWRPGIALGCEIRSNGVEAKSAHVDCFRNLDKAVRSRFPFGACRPGHEARENRDAPIAS